MKKYEKKKKKRTFQKKPLNISGSTILQFHGVFMPFCVNCGTSLESHMKFCWNCGTKQPDMRPARPQPPMQPYPPAQPYPGPVSPQPLVFNQPAGAGYPQPVVGVQMAQPPMAQTPQMQMQGMMPGTVVSVQEFEVLPCAFCHGEGEHPQNFRDPCPVCGGKGKVKVNKPNVVCKRCEGEGHEPFKLFDICKVCGGKGKTAL